MEPSVESRAAKKKRVGKIHKENDEASQPADNESVAEFDLFTEKGAVKRSGKGASGRFNEEEFEEEEKIEEEEISSGRLDFCGFD